MRAETTPRRSVPLVGDYGRSARATWRHVDWGEYGHDRGVAGSRLHYLAARQLCSRRQYRTSSLT